MIGPQLLYLALFSFALSSALFGFGNKTPAQPPPSPVVVSEPATEEAVTPEESEVTIPTDTNPPAKFSVASAVSFAKSVVTPELPHCTRNSTSFKCCFKVVVEQCWGFNVVPSNMKASISYSIANHMIINHDLISGEFCSIAPPPILYACINMYHVNLESKLISFCFNIVVLKTTTFEFGCLKFDRSGPNGPVIERNKEYLPPAPTGFIHVDLRDGIIPKVTPVEKKLFGFTLWGGAKKKAEEPLEEGKSPEPTK